MSYLSTSNSINRLAKKVQEDWSGEYVHFEAVELGLLQKLKIQVMSDHCTVISREGEPYVVQYRRMEGKFQTWIEKVISHLTQFPLREMQMKHVLSVGMNKLVRMLEADSNYEGVIEDHELRRIFNLIGIKLNSEQFMVKSASREMVTFTVPNNPNSSEKVFYTRLIKNSPTCSVEELERLRTFGVANFFDANLALPEDITAILTKMRIERPVADRDLARV